MVGPNNKGKETENDYRPNHGLIPPKRLTGVAGNNLRDTGNGRQKKNIHLGVSQEPEEVLEEKRATTAGKLHHSIGPGIESGRHEEGRTGHPVHELHNTSGFKRWEGKEEKESGHQHGPDEERKAHPSQSLGAQLNDGGDKVY